MPAPRIPLYKWLLSYFIPVRVHHTQGDVNEVLEVYMYCGQWQLATVDALYSDGSRYRPLISAFKLITGKLPQVKTVLVLGAGLGSAVKILNKKGYFPHVTLVDIDLQVLKLAIEFSDAAAVPLITPVCADAFKYISDCTDRYDIIIADVFKGRYVPDEATGTAFLQQCRERLNSGGTFILNYIINNEDDWQRSKNNIDRVFPANELIKLDINRIFVAK